MNKYYERALKETNATTAEQMREVAKYCIIDALSYQRLMVKRNVINEYREVTSIAFISLFNTHYFAIGMKVRNLLSASVWQEGILTSTISCEQTETEKYPEAYIFPPVKGLENRRPVTGLNFALLYPSLIMTYNFSPDKIILSREHAETLKKSEHGNQAKMKSFYLKVLEELLIRRNALKRRLAPLNDRKEELEKEISLAEAKSEDITDGLKSEYSSVCFNDACLDTKQLALKVYMNTFYDEVGNSRSPFFLQALAGGVTSADFLYLVCLEECFQECDEAYDSGNGILKEEYWSRMVNISIKEIERLHDEVKVFLRNDNGTSYLKMDVLRETIKDISRTDHNEIIKTTVWKPDKDNKKPGERFEYVMVENNLSERVRDKIEYPEVAR
ncbi:19691_t:CDS:2 [Funneliformis geosporum]|uniref:DNA-directed DNA polymerase n=1 Tax=Funneliformis geosporum TaxID=1117311 RepID=A0A9W4WT43_9GLOM|nr:19691_t:CDS:2 [Funneliformis geosporum]